MAVVTDKEYYIDDNILTIVDLTIKRQDKNWDNLFLFDGDEGSGKTSFAVALGYYIAEKTNTSFTTKNIFFDVNKMMDYAARTERQVILWDEAALGGLSTQWSNRVQNKLIQALMVARKKGHFWIFCIPKFYELRIYIVRRALGLIHVYSPDGINRGNFAYYKKEKKNNLYTQVKKTGSEFGYKNYNFVGKFINYGKIPLIDWVEYDKLKDDAIMSAFAEDQGVRSNDLIKIKYAYAQLLRIYNIPAIEGAKLVGKSVRTMSDWYNLPKDNAFLSESGGEELQEDGVTPDE